MIEEAALNAVKLKATAQCPITGEEVTLKHCAKECARFHHISYWGTTTITIYCKKG